MFLMRRCANVRARGGVSAAASRIVRAGGAARIGALAADAGLSLRQFERSFVKQVGVQPKLFARIARFEAVLDRKARSVRSWADVAQDFGYFDQMHMIHDFEEFTGQTPTLVLNQLETLFRGQIEAIRSAAHLAHPGSELQMMM
jgi:methylphosphotriester-DNA--protein-cysteine methyltransferase